MGWKNTMSKQLMKKPLFFAHSENKKGKKHLLSEHLYDTACYAESFSDNSLFAKLFRTSGLLHDLGKYQIDFQHYLERGGKKGSVPHAAWGAGYARIHQMNEISFAIDGHHNGLPNQATWQSDTNPFKHNDVINFKEAIDTFIEDTKIETFQPEPLNSKDKLERELFIRYLFSALTDADWLSTEKHFEQDKFDVRINQKLPIDDLILKLEKHLLEKPKSGEINKLRNLTRKQILKKATMPIGIYSLTLPTCLGKTLSSFLWALKHAKKNNLKRIIIVLPYINIIDQTAQILKEILGDDLILEHHSSYNEDEIKNKNGESLNTSLEYKKNLACENWDYPIIVTTTVQFFESLFSNKPSKCRKIHNIGKSVIIFDEIQALPKEIVLPTITMLKNIHKVMNTSFLFCTATQPAFEKRQKFDGLEKIEPLISDPSDLYEKTRRVDYHFVKDLEYIGYSDLSTLINQTNGSTLVIFNTKKATLEFFTNIQNQNSWDRKYHLSTAMCPAHRKKNHF